jgi:hypothetical protein
LPAPIKKLVTSTKRLRIEARQAIMNLKDLPENVGRMVDGRKSGDDNDGEELFDKELMVHLGQLYDQRTNVLYCLQARIKNGLRDGHIGQDRWGSRYYIMGGSWAKLIIETTTEKEGPSNKWYIVETPQALNNILSCLMMNGKYEGKLFKSIQTLLPLLHRTMKKRNAHEILKQMVSKASPVNGGPLMEMYELGGLYGALCPLIYVGNGEMPIIPTIESSMDGEKNEEKDEDGLGMEEWSFLTKTTSIDIFHGASLDALKHVSSSSSKLQLPHEHRILGLRLLLHEVLGMLEPSYFRVSSSSLPTSVNARSYFTSISLLLEHAERMTIENGDIYPLACVQLMLENAMKNEKMPEWWIESYRPVLPPRAPQYVDEYGRPTKLIPEKPTSYDIMLDSPLVWRTAIGGHFATAPTKITFNRKYKNEGLHGICSILESPTTSLLMVRLLAFRRAIRESQIVHWSGTEISAFKTCLKESYEKNDPVREVKHYPDEIIPPLSMFILDHSPPNTRNKWKIQNDIQSVSMISPTSARYMEGLEFGDELEC